MKKWIALVLTIAIGGALAWQFRLDLLLWGVPKLRAIASPIAPNVSVEWQQGPDTPTAAPAEPYVEGDEYIYWPN